MTKTKQQTINKAVSCRGIGLHSGQTSKIIFHPQPQNSGVIFKVGKNNIPALLKNVESTERGTTLCQNGIKIITVEHVLAAAYGLGIDNLLIEFEGNPSTLLEPPILDGSAIEYVGLLKSAAIKTLEASQKIIKIEKPISISHEDKKIEALPFDGFKVSFILDYPESFVGKQSAVFEMRNDNFEKEIAPARTYGFRSEVDQLFATGLAKGASTENAIVVEEKGYSCKLRFPDELVRHKILDVIGDLALLGAQLQGHIICNKSGHALNVLLARKLAG